MLDFNRHGSLDASGMHPLWAVVARRPPADRLSERWRRALRPLRSARPSRQTFSRRQLCGRPATMWRYAEVLPEAEPVSLGEGFTPMLPSREYLNGSTSKDEGLNPTGSFKARGLSAAVTMARHYWREESWRFLPPEMPQEPSPPMLPPPASKPTSSCRKMCPWQIESSGNTTVRTSRWSTA